MRISPLLEGGTLRAINTSNVMENWGDPYLGTFKVPDLIAKKIVGNGPVYGNNSPNIGNVSISTGITGGAWYLDKDQQDEYFSLGTIITSGYDQVIETTGCNIIGSQDVTITMREKKLSGVPQHNHIVFLSTPGINEWVGGASGDRYLQDYEVGTGRIDRWYPTGDGIVLTHKHGLLRSPLTDNTVATYDALDFAGGAVVHINAGMAAIAAAALVGRRRNIERGVEPHNVPYVILGASILWFGWFGFNAGSGLAADGLAVSAFLVTNTCAATAMMIWVILGMFHGGKVSGVGAATGAIAGLATITPASGFIGVESSLYLGIITGIITFYAVYFKSKVNLDDALDVFAVHGIGGIVGLIGTGIFATNGGLINGSSDLLVENFIMIVSTVAYSLIVSIVILKILDMIPGLGLRSEENEEDQGLDLSDHSERGYVADGAD